MSTKIEWCMNPDGTPGETWNPTIGCTRVSAGCQNCYAERMANRLSQNPATPEYAGLAKNGRWTGKVKCLPERLDQPLRWRNPKRIFVNSMSDLFHEDVPLDFICDVFNTMASATADCGKNHEHEEDCWCGPSHTYMILTKRPERMHRVLTEDLPFHVGNYWPGDTTLGIRREAGEWPLPNVWLGVSVENQQTADERISWLLKTPAAVRFVSCEPLLGEVSFRWAKWAPLLGANHLDGLRALDWVIAGGETGPAARPAHPDWFRGLRDQCAAASVPFFFKRHGAGNDSRLLDGVEHNAYPEGNHA